MFLSWGEAVRALMIPVGVLLALCSLFALAR